MSETVCTMASSRDKVLETVVAASKPKPLPIELSFERATIDGQDVLVPVCRRTGARILGVKSCSVGSGRDQVTVMALEVELEEGGSDGG